MARIPLEVMGGAAGGALSGFLVYSVGVLVLGACGDDLGCIITRILTTGGGIFLGTPLGVSVVGYLAGGQGSYWSALLGMTVGSGAAIVMAVALNNRSDDLQIASLVTLPAIGAVAGYEIGHAHRQPDLIWHARADAAGALPRIIPMLGFTPTGGVFGGLAGRF